MRQAICRPLVTVALLVGGTFASAAESAPSPEQTKFFESKIRPVLVDRCYQCHAHSAKQVQGSLLLDSRDGLRRGGDSGATIVPGNLEKSLLIIAIRYHDSDRAMPPKDAGGKLADSVIKDFEAWVKMGAPDPRSGAPKAAVGNNAEKGKTWWAFQPRKSVALPRLKDDHWAIDDLDRFVQAKLDEQKISPVEDAEPAVLLRRLYFDLTGLPPSPKDVADFVAQWNKSGDHEAVIAATVDRLLDSPQFGERWARHWLDVARYGESSGKDFNVVYPQAWRYRDYVIQSFNDDTPYDRFLREQIAGDLLPADSDAAKAHNFIATGFLALGPKSINEARAKQFVVDQADEQIDTTTQAFLGLTVSCARCHDHKFDPISQRDYTAISGIFLSTDTKFGTAGGITGRNQSSLIELPAKAGYPIAQQTIYPGQLARKQTRLDDLQKQRRDLVSARFRGGTAKDGLNPNDMARILTQTVQLETELSGLKKDGTPKTLAMGVTEKPLTAPMLRRFGFPINPNGPGGRQLYTGFEQIGDSPLFTRGNIDTPSRKVARAIPEIVAPHAKPIPAKSSGRLELADGLASADNPLTARVIVNRVWLWMFGRGLVESADNFGTSGTTPTHPELLDFLAERFVHEGWSIKRLVREVALSHTYRLAATYSEADFTADPENRYCWRHTSRRLEAEEIRDAMLSVAGRLELQPPVASLIGRGADGPLGGPRYMAMSEREIAQADITGRSIYLPLPRNVQPDVLAAFDMPDASAVQSARDATNVPGQALFLLNSEFVSKQSRALGAQVIKQYPGKHASDCFNDRIAVAYKQSLGRLPRDEEISAARKLIERHDNNPATAWTSLAQGLFACAEFRLVD